MRNIPKDLCYHTPVYIHSHPNSLYEGDNSVSSLVKNRISQKREEVLNQLKDIISFLKEFSLNETVQNFYRDTHVGSKRVHSKQGAKLVSSFNNFKNELKKIENVQDGYAKVVKNAVEEYLTNFFESNVGISIVDAFGENLSKEIVEFFKEEALFKNPNSKKYRNLKVEDDLSKLVRLRKGKITKEFQRILTKFLNSRNTQAANVERIIKDFEKDMNSYIKDFNDFFNLILDESSASQLRHIIDAFNGHKIAKYTNSASGSMFELVFNYLLLDTALKRYQGNYLGIEVTNGSYDQVPLGVQGSNVGSTGHGVTTDNIIKLIDKFGKEINMGFSLKAVHNNGQFNSTFTKTVYGKRIGNSLFNKDEKSKLLYYLGNEQASSIFLAPYKYGKVIKNVYTNDYNIPQNNKRKADYSVLLEIRKMFIYLMFVKGLLGSIFLKKDFEDLSEFKKYTPPIILSFVEEDYFTYEILERMVFLSENFVKSENENSSFNSFVTDVLEIPDFGFTEKNLTDLFITKKMIERTNASRYDDLRYNKVTYPWMDFAPYLSLKEALNDILKIKNYKGLADSLFKPVKFHIPINELVG